MDDTMRAASCTPRRWIPTMMRSSVPSFSSTISSAIRRSVRSMARASRTVLWRSVMRRQYGRRPMEIEAHRYANHESRWEQRAPSLDAKLWSDDHQPKLARVARRSERRSRNVACVELHRSETEREQHRVAERPVHEHVREGRPGSSAAELDVPDDDAVVDHR